MTTHDRVRLQLQALEALLREHQHWRNDEPCRINLTVLNRSLWTPWNHWSGLAVLIPRMHDLLDNNQPLPGAFAVAPYYEMALATDYPQRAYSGRAGKLDALLRMMRANAGNTLSG
ncbi:hypothetical protein DMI70_12030 [Escherichia coli]|nr:hypothetical protein [Escherichia coli]